MVATASLNVAGTVKLARGTETVVRLLTILLQIVADRAE